jgi:hypothetical protein
MRSAVGRPRTFLQREDDEDVYRALVDAGKIVRDERRFTLIGVTPKALTISACLT